MAFIKLEYEDIKPYLPKIILEVQKEVEKDRFISYPQGLQKFLCDGEVSRKTYQRVNKLWNQRKFPRKEISGIKGVYLSDLKNYENNKS